MCEAGGQRIRVFWVVGLVHAACWLPLYTDTLVEWGSQQKTITHEVTRPSCHVTSCHVMSCHVMYPQLSLHLGFLHAAVNPVLHLVLDPSLRLTLLTTFFCRDTQPHTQAHSSRKGEFKLELKTKVHMKVRKRGEGPYYDLMAFASVSQFHVYLPWVNACLQCLLFSIVS